MSKPTGEDEVESGDAPDPDDFEEMEHVLPIDGTLDLHTFSPREVKELVPDYITECLAQNIFALRIVHGKGLGVLRRSVHAILSRDPRVESFHLADESGGGWGATLVLLHREDLRAKRSS